MQKQLSILIPTFNTVCVPLVQTLAAQAECIEGLEWEIIVADDGSTDASCLSENEAIKEIRNCYFFINKINIGRAAIRNALGRKAHYSWLLFLDSDVEIPSAYFLDNYLVTIEAQSQSNGGLNGSQRRLNRSPFKPPLALNGGLIASSLSHDQKVAENLRYRYEKACEHKLRAEERAKHPYRSFRSTNFIVSKEVFERCKFDEALTTYGYEDVLFGKSLRENGVQILHIDNPIAYTEYEDNAAFLAKTEEAMRTLSSLYSTLDGYSPIISLCKTICRLHLQGLLVRLFEARKAAWRSNLLSVNPSLLLFKLYKLGYFLTVHTRP